MDLHMDIQQRKNWYTIFTRPRTEKKVASQVEELGAESFLPVHKVIKQWSDRKKRMEVPLFPNYVFVRTHEKALHSLFTIKHLVKFVSIERRPVVVREKEIDTIKLILNEDTELSSCENFQEGRKVRILRGHLAGLEGVIVKQNSKTRLIIKIEGLERSLSINMPANYAEII